MFYKKQLNKTLQQAVEEATSQAPAQQMQLFEEIALMRAAAAQAVKLFSRAEESGDTELTAKAAALMQDQLKEVVHTCEAASRIHNAGKDQFSVYNLMHVVQEIVKVAYDVFGDDMDRAKEFEMLVHQRVKLASGTPGTRLTPDQDVSEMDKTVP